MHFSLKNHFFSMTGKKLIKLMSNVFSLCSVWYLMKINSRTCTVIRDIRVCSVAAWYLIRINLWYTRTYYCFVRFSFLIDVEAFYSFYIDSETPMLRNFHLPVEFFLIFSFKDKTCWIIIQCIQSTSMAMVFCTPRDHYQIYILNCHSSLIFQPICLKFGVHVL